MSKTKKIIIWISVITISTLVLLFFFPLIVHYLQPTKFTDEFFLQDAEFAKIDFANIKSGRCVDREDCNDPISFHRLKKGSGHIIGIRKYDRGTHAIDDETFEKLTIWINDPKEGEYLLSDPGIIAYYSRGASAWPDTQCGSRITDGKLKILKSTYENQEFKIQAAFKCINQRGTKDIVLNETYDSKVITWETITPWLGSTGSGYYQESYRKMLNQY